MITNKHGFPREVYDALCKNRYSGDSDEVKADYSATTIIAPVQQTILKERYPDANTEDAVDRVWSLFGHLAHSLLEEHGSDDALCEKRFFTTILGLTVSGQVDVYKDKTITDYKTTAAYKIKKKSFVEWEQQLNIYAYLARLHGLTVNHLRIIAIIRDWSEADSYQQDYPKAPIVEIPLSLWTIDMQRYYVEDRINLLKSYEETKDDELLPCTNSERWMDDSKWAVLKKDGKRAIRVFDTEKEACEYIELLDVSKRSGSEYVSERPAEPRRCLKYCSVSSVCTQHASYLKQKGDTSELHTE